MKFLSKVTVSQYITSWQEKRKLWELKKTMMDGRNKKIKIADQKAHVACVIWRAYVVTWEKIRIDIFELDLGRTLRKL